MFDPIPDHAQAWRNLPVAQQGPGQPLPAWARLLSAWLPRSTAALLQLDAAHRQAGPVPQALRSAQRFVAAQANQCPSGMACAQSDMLRAGAPAEHLDLLRHGAYENWPYPERLALEFAGRMTRDSASVTDAEFAELVGAFGPDQAAAMVLHLAYANFQDRLWHCLGLASPASEPLPPIEVAFAPKAFVVEMVPPSGGGAAPASHGTREGNEPSPPGPPGPAWVELQLRLEAQRRRPARLPIPEWRDVAPNVPAALFPAPTRIVWYLVVLGYAAELAVPFELFMRTLAAESAPNWDRILGGSLFWVTTQAVDCPYCMGHCEMNWEVAGLIAAQIAARGQRLAAGTWEDFSAAERCALAFARKLSLAPWQVSRGDVDELVAHFGARRALVMLLHASRYHYMTRVSNGFQLPLERDNVFFDYYGVKPQAN